MLLVDVRRLLFCPSTGRPGRRLVVGETGPRRSCHNAQIDCPLSVEKLRRESDHLGAVRVKVEAGNVPGNCAMVWCGNGLSNGTALGGLARTMEETAELGPCSQFC